MCAYIGNAVVSDANRNLIHEGAAIAAIPEVPMSMCQIEHLNINSIL